MVDSATPDQPEVATDIEAEVTFGACPEDAPKAKESWGRLKRAARAFMKAARPFAARKADILNRTIDSEGRKRIATADEKDYTSIAAYHAARSQNAKATKDEISVLQTIETLPPHMRGFVLERFVGAMSHLDHRRQEVDAARPQFATDEDIKRLLARAVQDFEERTGDRVLLEERPPPHQLEAASDRLD